MKDTGQIQESIPYYRRAVELNPNFPEAVCGLVNALGGVCDWQGRGGVEVSLQSSHQPVQELNKIDFQPLGGMDR